MDLIKVPMNFWVQHDAVWETLFPIMSYRTFVVLVTFVKSFSCHRRTFFSSCYIIDFLFISSYKFISYVIVELFSSYVIL